jgi:3-deoxy-7-phosphoheptulonate synthase
LVSWGAIGARTTESQVHRELASGLSMPVGFKNGTDGNVRVAIEAIQTARRAHHFLSVTKEGLSAIVASHGNDCCHVILRGGSQGPNYDTANVSEVTRALGEAGLPQRIVIDCSHGNSCKDPERQPLVANQIGERVAAGERLVVGLMLESHLVGGRQDCAPAQAMIYGQSITDACLSWDATVPVLDALATAVRRRREASAKVGHAPVNRGYAPAMNQSGTEVAPR